MVRGTVKRIKAGYGFLTLEDGRDVFFLPTHLSDKRRFDDLSEGAAVECEFEGSAPDDKGRPRWRATSVVILG